MKYRVQVTLVASAILCLFSQVSGAASRWYDASLPARGAVVFQQYCAACHGANAGGIQGEGTTANNAVLPPALNGTAHAWHHSSEVLTNIIRNGGSKIGSSNDKGTMPSFKEVLSDSEIETVIAYFQSIWPDDIYQRWAATNAANNSQNDTALTGGAAQMAAGVSAMTAMLRSRLGSDRVSDPVTTPIMGIYLTRFGSNLAYLGGNGRYLFMGDLLDLKLERNLTNNARENIKTDEVMVAEADVGVPGDNPDITRLLKLRLGSNEVSDAVKTPVEGIFVSRFGANYAYLSAQGRYVIMGSMIDLKQGVNLTSIAKKRTAVAILRSFDARDKAVYPAIGEEKAVLNILTDTTCPYCKKLHSELPKLRQAGISIHYLPYPRGGSRGEGYDSLKQVWCATDRERALSIGKGLEPGELPLGDCEGGALVDRGFKVGNDLGIAGTPAIFTSDGELIQGYRPYQELIQKVLGE